MKTKRFLSASIIMCIAFTIVPALNAQEPAGDDNAILPHSLGIGAGFTTGVGLSYRYVPASFGGQVTFAPYSDNYTTQASFGATLLYFLRRNEFTNLFLYQGNHFVYFNDKEWYYDNGQIDSYTKSYWNNGVGIGIEIIILQRIGFNMMGGYGFYENFSRLSFTGETGLYYHF